MSSQVEEDIIAIPDVGSFSEYSDDFDPSESADAVGDMTDKLKTMTFGRRPGLKLQLSNSTDFSSDGIHFDGQEDEESDEVASLPESALSGRPTRQDSTRQSYDVTQGGTLRLAEGFQINRSGIKATPDRRLMSMFEAGEPDAEQTDQQKNESPQENHPELGRSLDPDQLFNVRELGRGQTGGVHLSLYSPTLELMALKVCVCILSFVVLSHTV